MASKKQTVISRPLARTENVVVESVGDETVIYDTQAHVAHALKPLAAAVYAYADGKNTPGEIAELASYRLATTVTEADVVGALEQLDATALLDGPVLDVHTGISRRTALKTFAAAGAGSMLVMSVATTAAQACYTCTTGQIPGSSTACVKNATFPNDGGPGDCRLCDANGPCYTKGSNATCCCAPCDGSAAKCCQPICIQSTGSCPTGTLPLGHTVGGENAGYSKIACPSNYGAYQAGSYNVKCCLAGNNGAGNKNTGSTYCECTDPAGTCGTYGTKSGKSVCIPTT